MLTHPLFLGGGRLGAPAEENRGCCEVLGGMLEEQCAIAIILGVFVDALMHVSFVHVGGRWLPVSRSIPRLILLASSWWRLANSSSS